MAADRRGSWGRFRELVFSDLQRYRPDEEPSWARVVARFPSLPGMLASVIVRAQQVLYDGGHEGLASRMRTLSVMLINMDILPGMDIGPGLLLAHPGGVAIGSRLTIGANVSLGGGVTCAAHDPFETGPQEFATLCDGSVIGAHAVLVGPVRIGKGALVGANAVVLSDVPDYAVVMGNPARQVGAREPAAGEPRATDELEATKDTAAS